MYLQKSFKAGVSRAGEWDEIRGGGASMWVIHKLRRVKGVAIVWELMWYVEKHHYSVTLQDYTITSGYPIYDPAFLSHHTPRSNFNYRKYLLLQYKNKIYHTLCTLRRGLGYGLYNWIKTRAQLTEIIN